MRRRSMKLMASRLRAIAEVEHIVRKQREVEMRHSDDSGKNNANHKESGQLDSRPFRPEVQPRDRCHLSDLGLGKRD
eukprot:g7820.t1